MDEAAYHARRQACATQACVFEKAVLAGCAHCRLAERINLAEREVVACKHPLAQVNCQTLAALLRERATFMLHLPAPSQPIAHSKALQIQCGGLHGLHAVLGAAEIDVHALVHGAQQQYGSLLDLPWPALLSHLSDWTPKRRWVKPSAKS